MDYFISIFCNLVTLIILASRSLSRSLLRMISRRNHRSRWNLVLRNYFPCFPPFRALYHACLVAGAKKMEIIESNLPWWKLNPQTIAFACICCTSASRWTILYYFTIFYSSTLSATNYSKVSTDTLITN